MNNDQLKVDKYLPHNFLAEKIILGNLLFNSGAVEQALQTIEIEAFYFKTHQEIYKSIISLHNNKEIINLTTLTTYLQSNGLLKKIGGVSTLIDLVNQAPNLVDLDDYIKLLQERFLRRILIKLGYQIINSGYVTNISIEKIINDLENEVFKLSQKTEQTAVISSAELLSLVFKELKLKSLNAKLPGIISGFQDLDALTQGFQKSDLVIVAGRPSMGKTAFCLNVATTVVCQEKVPVIFFSLEMSKEQLTYRLLSTQTKINNARLKSGRIKTAEWKILNSTIKELSTLPIFIDDTPNISTLDIRSKLKKIIIEHNKIGMVVIDYLQLMENSSSKTNNRVQELTQITRELKTIAREFKVPIVVLSQLSRNVENRTNKRPILSDLRESGSIEQDADLVLMLYRDDYYNLATDEPNVAELIVAKHRNGPTGLIKLLFNSKYTEFVNM